MLAVQPTDFLLVLGRGEKLSPNIYLIPYSSSIEPTSFATMAALAQLFLFAAAWALKANLDDFLRQLALGPS